jgi:hypothetical protein
MINGKMVKLKMRRIEAAQLLKTIKTTEGLKNS